MRRRVKSANRKVRNATTVHADGYTFKSKLEFYCYEYFKEQGLLLDYEKEKFTVWDGCPLPEFLHVWFDRKMRDSKAHALKQSKSRLMNITYTPDFILQKDGKMFVIETKGNPNDNYPIYRKLFLAHVARMRDDGNDWYFFEPHNQSEVREACDIIKQILEYGKQ